MNIKALMFIVLFHLFALFIFLTPFAYSKKMCYFHKKNESIKYLVDSEETFSIQGDYLIKVDPIKEYIQNEYLNEFFNKEICSKEVKQKTIIENGNISESLRIWQMNTDLGN